MTGPHLIHSRHVVLVIDDDAQVLRTLHDILSRDGCDVLTARDAAQALALVEATVPFIILSDVEMPGMNGFELCRHLKHEPRTARVPVVLVTSRIEEADVKEGVAAGAVDFIKKPFDKDEVVLRVRTQIHLHEAMIEILESEAKFRGLFESSRDAIMTLAPPTWSFTDANPATLAMFGAKDLADFTSRGFADLSPETQPGGCASGDSAKEMIGRAIREGSAYFEWMHKRIDGEEFPATVLLTRVDLGGKQSIQATVRNISEQKKIEAELGHARKLEAVGQLAAGIAHEINTPTQFVGDSISFLADSYKDVQPLFAKYREVMTVLASASGFEALAREMKESESAADLAYMQEHTPAVFARAVDGISRISTIVRAMKEFAHPDQKEKSSADLNQALQSTLIIAKNEYKYVADVTTELGELPPVICHVGDLNQVFLNLIVNAAHAIGDVVGQSGTKGQIRIRTLREGDFVRIEIADTGSGIPESIRHRIFEPFFTTKEVGKGSGQGLAIARSIVVNKHGGLLTFESEVGKGTTFIMRLPIAGRP